MQRITRAQLERMLRSLRGTTMVGLIARTVPEMRLRGNPYRDNLVKLAHVQGVIGFRYSSSVNRQRARERRPTTHKGMVSYFYAEPRQWGERVRGTPLVEHELQGSGRWHAYLEIKVERVIHAEYRTIDPDLRVDDAEVERWLKRRRPNRRQGVRREVQLRDYRLDHLLEIRMHGGVWQVDHEGERSAA